MVKVSLSGNSIYLQITFDQGMGCHSTTIELFYFDDNFRRIAQLVLAFKGPAGTPVPNHNECLRSNYCPKLNTDGQILCSASGRFYSCSSDLVFCITCKMCEIQYVNWRYATKKRTFQKSPTMTWTGRLPDILMMTITIGKMSL